MKEQLASLIPNRSYPAIISTISRKAEHFSKCNSFWTFRSSAAKAQTWTARYSNFSACWEMTWDIALFHSAIYSLWSTDRLTMPGWEPRYATRCGFKGDGLSVNAGGN